MNEERFKYLLGLYQANNVSIEEHDELFEMIDSSRYDNVLDKAVLSDLRLENESDVADLPPHIAHDIIRNIYEAEKNVKKMLPTKRAIPIIYRWIAAASVIAIIGLASLFFQYSNDGSKKQFTAIIPKYTITVANTKNEQQLVVLSDGSKVTLAPNSSIHYSRIFAGETRDVYLEGEAFFQVTKNPVKPFMVYYNNIVTKVLGTSFTINTNKTTGNVEVAVKTGKVQVFENEKLLSITERTNKASTILTPNQKAVYNLNLHLFENRIVEKPERILPNDTAVVNTKEVLVFDQEKLRSIFIKLQSYYGIDIVVESTNLYNCSFSGDISNIDLFSVLKSICIATNSSFEVNGTKILIKGNGCD